MRGISAGILCVTFKKLIAIIFCGYSKIQTESGKKFPDGEVLIVLPVNRGGTRDESHCKDDLCDRNITNTNGGCIVLMFREWVLSREKLRLACIAFIHHHGGDECIAEGISETVDLIVVHPLKK